MAKYKFIAIDQTGKQKSGRIDAASQEEASAKVSAMGLMVNKIEQIASAPAAKQQRKTSKGLGFSFGKVVNQEELAVFTRQLATLLQAGLPLLRSLEVMIRQEKKPAFREVLIALADNVRSGNNFSDGLQQHPKIFDRLYVNMVRAGEAGGVLDVVLSRLALFMEKSVKTQKKVKSAMVYPAVVCSVAIAIVVLLMVFVVPRFQGIFNDMLGGAPMPPLTAFIIGISDFLVNNVLIAIGLVVIIVFAIKFGAKTKSGKHLLDWAKLNTPKFGELGQKATIARFTRTFGTLMSSGVPILQALTITRDTIDNGIVANALDNVHNRVRDGEPLAAPMEQQKLFPTMVTSMIDVGEETGELPEMLNRVADNYDEDLDNAVASITSIIEPIMIVFLAVVVGVIVIALFLPIIGIIEGLAG